MRLLTEADFVKKSKEVHIVSEEHKIDIEMKYRYLRSYLDNLREYVGTHKINKAVEVPEHGREYMNLKHRSKIMNSRKFTAMCSEIRLIETECTRLLRLLNA